MDKRSLADGWAEFLSREKWDLFVTVTFRNSTKIIIAKKLFKRFFKHLNTAAGEFFDKYIRCWVFFEKDADRQGVHVHALVRGIHPSKAKEIEKRCKERLGESKVEEYDATGGAIEYLANKQNSRKLEDYDRCRINSRKRQRPMLGMK
jgi:hypothetical protein